MDNKELKELIESFKGYRDLIGPIQKNLNEFLDTYQNMQSNIDSLNASFGSDLKTKLEDLFKQMTAQASKANDLASKVEQLSSSANKYAGEVNAVANKFGEVERRLSAVSELDKRVESQLSKLDSVLEEKSRVYNLKDLEKALNEYNKDIKQVSAFLNTDIAKTLIDSKASVDSIKGGLEEIVRRYKDEDTTLEKLLKSHMASTDFLRKITESSDINEAYLFDVLDRWAESRRVKIKK